METEMIIINKQWPEYTAINTELFIRRTIGHNNPENGIELPDIIYNAEWNDESDLIALFISDRDNTPYKSVYRDNVYNHANDLSDVFVFEVFAPENTSDWCYSDDIYVAVSVHRGGDVRGNYGATRLYRVADCIAESGFLDWVIGWDVCDLQGNRIDDDITERFAIGYSSYPWGELMNCIPEKTIHWSDKRQSLVGRYNGNTVLIQPYTNIY